MDLGPLAPAGFSLVVTVIAKLARKQLMAFWQRGGMWGFRSTPEQATRLHSRFVLLCLGLTAFLALLGIVAIVTE